VFTDEVKKALEMGKPVVALESTIITHGMEYPMNVKTAKAVEDIVREQGAIPATMAIIKGQIRVGLTDDDLEFLAQNAKTCRKCSRRDLAYALARGENGSTTVAATMYLAHIAGIRVFVTGGIGGVHRGAE
jgi:pseudouridine-5'-phosphate glycosidase